MGNSKTPRRVIQTEQVPAEKAINAAMVEVEKLPADVRLTNAIAALQQALEHVGDYIDDNLPG
jgi:hypothetical protein